jgi:hypothetical protein
MCQENNAATLFLRDYGHSGVKPLRISGVHPSFTPMPRVLPSGEGDRAPSIAGVLPALSHLIPPHPPRSLRALRAVRPCRVACDRAKGR